MKPGSRLPSVPGGQLPSAAFTVTELLVVIAALALLAALLLPAMANAKGKAQQSGCAANLEQVNLAFQMWVHDNNGWLPPGADTSEGLGLAQPCTYADDAPSRRALPFYLASYLAYPAPDLQMRVAKVFCCPGLSPCTGESTNLTQRVAYGLSTKGTGNSPGQTGLPFNPFGSPAVPARLAERPRKLLEVQNFRSLSSVWFLADMDKLCVAEGQASERDLLPDQPPHGRLRNFLFFDGHVTARVILQP